MQRAGRRVRIDLDLDVQAVVAQQHSARRIAVEHEACKLFWIGQRGLGAVLERYAQGARAVRAADGERLHHRVASGGQRCAGVEKTHRVVDHTRAAHGVEARALVRAVVLGDDVRTVQRVVQAAPACVGRVERIASVVDRHHELRSRRAAELRVDVGRRDAEVAALGNAIANFLEKRPGARRISGLTLVLPVEGIDLFLKGVALVQQGGVLRREVARDVPERLPEGGRLHASARGDLVVHEVVNLARDTQAARFYVAAGHAVWFLDSPGLVPSGDTQALIVAKPTMKTQRPIPHNNTSMLRTATCDEARKTPAQPAPYGAAGKSPMTRIAPCGAAEKMLAIPR